MARFQLDPANLPALTGEQAARRSEDSLLAVPGSQPCRSGSRHGM